LLWIAGTEKLPASGQRCMPRVVDVGGNAAAAAVRRRPADAACRIGAPFAQVAGVQIGRDSALAIGVRGKIEYPADAKADQILGHVRPCRRVVLGIEVLLRRHRHVRVVAAAVLANDKLHRTGVGEYTGVRIWQVRRHILAVGRIEEVGPEVGSPIDHGDVGQRYRPRSVMLRRINRSDIARAAGIGRRKRNSVGQVRGERLHAGQTAVHVPQTVRQQHMEILAAIELVAGIAGGVEGAFLGRLPVGIREITRRTRIAVSALEECARTNERASRRRTPARTHIEYPIEESAAIAIRWRRDRA